MGNQQSVKVIGPEDFLPRETNPCGEINLSDLMKYYNAIMASMPTRRPAWDYQAEYASLNEPTTKQSAAQNLQNSKRASYAALYSAAPKKLDWKLSRVAIASGSTSGGTHQKDKQNGNK